MLNVGLAGRVPMGKRRHSEALETEKAKEDREMAQKRARLLPDTAALF